MFYFKEQIHSFFIISRIPVDTNPVFEASLGIAKSVWEWGEKEGSRRHWGGGQEFDSFAQFRRLEPGKNKLLYKNRIMLPY